MPRCARQVYEPSREARRPSAPNSVINKADILPALDRYGMEVDRRWMCDAKARHTDRSWLTMGQKPAEDVYSCSYNAVNGGHYVGS